MTASAQTIPVDRIFLDLFNPRHKAYENEQEVIDYLCRHEQILPLARDMAFIGLNPLEAFAVMQIGPKSTRKQTYVIAEGNRRLCAIKLLHDPDRAPTHVRKEFWKLANESPRSFARVPAVIFRNKAELDPWLERIHGGVQGGVGRKPWSPEQKTRHIGDRKNVTAQKILDYAEKCEMLSTTERKGKLTTAQRYLGNVVLREAIGIESTPAGELRRTRPQEEFDLLIRTFVRDLVSRKVHSRSDSEEIKDYARSLIGREGVSTTRVIATAVSTGSASRRVKKRPTEPDKPKAIIFEPGIEEGLKRIGSYKLQKLYFSICDIPLEKHTPLVSIGVWAFIETLTAWCGRDPSSSFISFFSKERLSTLSFNDRDRKNAISSALTRISAYGNTTKHHETSANFNGEQLVNDMETLAELLTKLLATV